MMTVIKMVEKKWTGDADGEYMYPEDDDPRDDGDDFASLGHQ